MGFVATAAAIVLIVFAMVSVFRMSHVASFLLLFRWEVITRFTEYVPRTIELVAASFVVASTAGLLPVLPFARVVKPLIMGVALGLQCIPFFWLAIAMEFALILLAKPITGTEGFNFFVPIGVLAMFQFPTIVEYLDKRFALGTNLRVTASSILGGLAKQFARDLPDLLAATLITEIVFGWQGVGWLSWRPIEVGIPITGLLLFMALSVLVTRSFVEALTRGTSETTDCHA